jgi:Asp-tRNA(Asn)/Glu-tRNA(Gln) amidotransferase A subunit family amidase
MFVDTDVVLTPAAPGDPLFSRGWNLLQVTLPVDPFRPGPNGLPLSIQLVGPMGADDGLLAAARWIANTLSADQV